MAFYYHRSRACVRSHGIALQVRARLLADEEEREAQRLAAEAVELLKGKVEAKAELLDQLDDLLARETLSMEARALGLGRIPATQYSDMSNR